ncbi:DUF2997 domain-containing protein [Bacillus sp. CHD6a]|uniref:DUF2997 domain-containing protein n=1 Tax=Bacillus sp. CHD6a TaxID=1643452 RepID=UPI0006CDA881|nr:DUF2997 domain-containing protein [Bacillus sp. CHD6a]KPB03422.1 hypothetical protein AAV98_17120 [Bacillus sp. CHD6a]
MPKKIIIEITQDGKILAETLGVKGKECLTYITLLEELLEAETIDSSYTEEFHETEVHITQETKLNLKER